MLDWSRIKTIFIIAFLILDLYLAYEYYKLYNLHQYDYMSETTFESRLKAEEIQYPPNLPKNIKKESYISASPKTFSKEEIDKQLSSILKGQRVNISNGTTIEGYFEKPYKLNKTDETSELSLFLRKHIYLGEQYRFWEKDEDNHMIIFFQEYNGKMLYKNINGQLILYLNKNDEIVSYKQTILTDFKEFPEKETILQPLKVIEILYENGKLKFGDKITSIEEGYFTLVHLSSSQVMTPVWLTVVNGKENLFVNAIEGEIIQLHNEEKKIVE